MRRVPVAGSKYCRVYRRPNEIGIPFAPTDLEHMEKTGEIVHICPLCHERCGPDPKDLYDEFGEDETRADSYQIHYKEKHEST